ncbi:MAG: sensor histidine kinase [Verrucomicrobiota bacterium]
MSFSNDTFITVLSFLSLSRRKAFVAILTAVLTLSAKAQELPLSTLQEIQALGRADVQSLPKVRIRGIVIQRNYGLFSPPNADLVTFKMQDNAAGIAVTLKPWGREWPTFWDGSEEEKLSIQPGVEVEVEGTLYPGDWAPNIHATKVTILGKKDLPAPFKPSERELYTGAIRAIRVEVSGVIQSIINDTSTGRVDLKLSTGIRHLLIRIPKKESLAAAQLLDAEVELTAPVSAMFNQRGEYAGPYVAPNRLDDIVVKKAPINEPFAQRKLPLNQLNEYRLGGTPQHRLLTEGTVTYVESDSFLIIQDEDCAVRVTTVNAAPISVGDRIEVAGFIDTSRQFAEIDGAFVRKIGTAPMPIPESVTLSTILEKHWNFVRHYKPSSSHNDNDGQLISVTGTLINLVKGRDGRHELELDCGDALSSAFLHGDLPELLIGSRLKLIGAASIQYKPQVPANIPESLTVLLRDARDITVLTRPSWWNYERTRGALFAVIGLASIGFGWAAFLRRTVQKRTQELAEEMRQRRDAAIEFEAALRERSRLAANLHDTVLQTVTGLAMQIETCHAHLPGEQETVAGHLDLALKMARSGQKDLRNSVWALHSLPMKENTFSEAVRSVARQITAGSSLQIEIEGGTESLPLADFVAGNLLLIVQEAIHNILKHACASKARITLATSENGTRFSVAISDNGAGFQPGSQPGNESGHFGLTGMQERAKRLGGTLAVESHLGAGTIIRVEVPLRSFDNELT